jgi:hypothetical protein
MTTDQYLKELLSQQRLTDEELNELRAHRADVQAVLEDHFSESSPDIRYAGSYKKKTMIRDAYDLDVACYFGHEDTAAGETLSDIYNACANALAEDYHVERKRSALRVMEKGALVSRTDFRIDVVPGRYTSEERGDAFLHQEEGGKTRLKTNLQVHVEHIRDSGIRDAIKLLKLWRYQRSIQIKTFVLELLAVDLLRYRKAAKLSVQLEHVFTVFRDDADGLHVKDPANSNNDLKPFVDEARSDLAAWASRTLEYIDDHDWESVFGKLSKEVKTEAALSTAIGQAASRTTPSRPWLPTR